MQFQQRLIEVELLHTSLNIREGQKERKKGRKKESNVSLNRQPINLLLVAAHHLCVFVYHTHRPVMLQAQAATQKTT